VWGVLHVLLGRNFVSDLPTLKPKNLIFSLKNLGFYQPWCIHTLKQHRSLDKTWLPVSHVLRKRTCPKLGLTFVPAMNKRKVVALVVTTFIVHYTFVKFCVMFLYCADIWCSLIHKTNYKIYSYTVFYILRRRESLMRSRPIMYHQKVA